MINVFQVGGVIGLAAGRQDDGADVDFFYFGLLAVIDSMGQTGIHALIALAAIAAVQAAGRFSPAFFFGVPQFDFIEVALALADGQLGHLGPLH